MDVQAPLSLVKKTFGPQSGKQLFAPGMIVLIVLMMFSSTALLNLPVKGIADAQKSLLASSMVVMWPLIVQICCVWGWRFYWPPVGGVACHSVGPVFIFYRPRAREDLQASSDHLPTPGLEPGVGLVETSQCSHQRLEVADDDRCVEDHLRRE